MPNPFYERQLEQYREGMKNNLDIMRAIEAGTMWSGGSVGAATVDTTSESLDRARKGFAAYYIAFDIAYASIEQD